MRNGVMGMIGVGLLCLAVQHADAQQASVWDGVFTAAQAQRGATIYAGSCAHCHGANGNGANEPDMPRSPAIARASFITRWQGKPLSELFVLVKTTMPEDNPASLSDQEVIDAIAHMLTLSAMPAGSTELPADSARLAGTVIGPQPPR